MWQQTCLIINEIKGMKKFNLSVAFRISMFYIKKITKNVGDVIIFIYIIVCSYLPVYGQLFNTYKLMCFISTNIGTIHQGK